MSTLPLPPASTLRRPPRFPTAAAAILCLTGLVLFGQGIWIHAKALLAQVLLERAFAASLARRHDVKPWPWADTWPVAQLLNACIAAGRAGGSGQSLISVSRRRQSSARRARCASRHELCVSRRGTDR